MSGFSKSSSGFTLTEMLAVITVLAVLLALILPAWTGRSRTNHGQVRCQNNLKQVGLSFRQWALDNDGKFPTQISVTNGGAMEWARSGIIWPVFQVMSNELNVPKVLFCLSDPDTNRVMASTFGGLSPQSSTNDLPFTNNQSVNYFVGLDATDSQPKLLLVGDNHFEVDGKPLLAGLRELDSQQRICWTAARHPKHTGNLGFVDGSVRPFATKELPAVFKATGLVTNRLVLP